MSHGPFGKRVERLPVEQGGTAASTPDEARKQLGVPSLAGDNTFVGDQVVQGLLEADQLHANLSITTDGTLVIEEATIDASLLTGSRSLQLPDNSGVFALLADINTELPEWAYIAKTGTYVLTDADCVCNCTSGTFTVTLPTAVGRTGKMFTVKNSGAGLVTLDGDGAETIDGVATQAIAAGASLTVVSTGSAWIII